MKYEDYINELKTGMFDVTFTKVNGEIRNMTCTLEKSMLPEVVIKEPVTEETKEKVRKVNTEAVKVWDLDAKGWRSFRIDSVTNFTKIYSTESVK